MWVTATITLFIFGLLLLAKLSRSYADKVYGEFVERIDQEYGFKKYDETRDCKKGRTAEFMNDEGLKLFLVGNNFKLKLPDGRQVADGKFNNFSPVLKALHKHCD
jgi:hypothetical protein